jgi:hypothetical protein
MKCDKNKMARDFSAILHVPKTLEFIPSIIGDTLDIHFKSTGCQWLRALESNAVLESAIMLKINEAADEVFNALKIAHSEGDVLA